MFLCVCRAKMEAVSDSHYAAKGALKLTRVSSTVKGMREGVERIYSQICPCIKYMYI